MSTNRPDLTGIILDMAYALDSFNWCVKYLYSEAGAWTPTEAIPTDEIREIVEKHWRDPDSMVDRLMRIRETMHEFAERDALTPKGG